MLSTLSLLTFSTLAVAQWQGQGQGPPNGAWAGLPSCFSGSLSDSGCDLGDNSCYCSASTISKLNSYVDSSSCSTSDKEAVYQIVGQLCANTGSTITASQEATFSATSGGTAWPTQWSSNGAWQSALSSWKTQTTGVPFAGAWGPGGPGGAGWSGSHGPFGGAGNGWGQWSTDATGAWTNGPWTKWWGTNACPPSTWSGWTSGSWSATPSWTSWTACTASTTATSVVTTTVTSGSSTGTITSTSFAIRVQQTDGTSSGSGAAPTNHGVLGAAAGVAGMIVGAALL